MARVAAAVQPIACATRRLESVAAARIAARIPLAALCLCALMVGCGPAQAQDLLKVGSKRFTESYILGELIVRAAGGPAFASHAAGLGNTGILYAALRAGSIDVYPEYTGTIAREILKLDGNPSSRELNAALAPHGIAVSAPLGFNNTYAIGVRAALAERLQLRTIGDLARHPQLRFGFSHEFLARKDGWAGLAQAYGLQASPSGLDHGLAYEALAADRVDVIDVYSTDAKVLRHDVRVLADDRNYFPRYDAVLLHRADVPQRFPEQWKRIESRLAGAIDAAQMMRMNAAAELQGRTFAAAAAGFFSEASAAEPRRSLLTVLLGSDLARLTREHLLLVFGSVGASTLVGVPLGIAAARWRRLAQPVFALTGILQTIPSLALLAFLVAAIGAIGVGPALIALFLYGLLPIVRNTHAGLLGVGEGVGQAARALGLSARDRLLAIELPLAAPSILAGVKTSAVINVGTATIAAFVGAGGYGERIAAGLALNDSVLLLAGAIPAAVLALLTQALLEWAERRALPWQRAALQRRP
jgi:osmoprotectant transport system permease protein